MTLPASGTISLNQVNVELGLSGTASINMNAANVRGLFAVASGAISMSNGHGKANQFLFSITANTTYANISTLATAAGWNGSSNVVCTINSGVWVYSDNTTAALTIPNSFPNGITLKNYGKVIGKGGTGGGYGAETGLVGRVAILNSKTGAVIQNMSGGYIAGGGGGGGCIRYYTAPERGGGGGGAGGGVGGYARARNGSTANGGSAGGLGAAGGKGGSYSAYIAWENLRGLGGGAGGGSGMGWDTTVGAGGGGGRILPGSGGGGNRQCGNVGAGGSAGAGGGGGYNYQGYFAAGGGGGWGAAGGSANSTNNGIVSGGAGGKAISSGVTYTLSNSGTIYGAT
jgi:hypothetical protein